MRVVTLRAEGGNEFVPSGTADWGRRTIEFVCLFDWESFVAFLRLLDLSISIIRNARIFTRQASSRRRSLAANDPSQASGCWPCVGLSLVMRGSRFLSTGASRLEGLRAVLISRLRSAVDKLSRAYVSRHTQDPGRQ